MSEGPEPQISDLLLATHRGNPQAAEELIPLVYSELRRLAQSKMNNLPPNMTLQPTALVHEAFVRVVGKSDPGWNSKGHFFAAAAEAMRRILVEQFRRKRRLKHGGGKRREPLNDENLAIEVPGEDLVAIDEVLKELEATDARKGQIVNLRYFVGLTSQETASALGVSVSTVEREWRYCRRWLFQRLKDFDETQ